MGKYIAIVQPVAEVGPQEQNQQMQSDLFQPGPDGFGPGQPGGTRRKQRCSTVGPERPVPVALIGLQPGIKRQPGPNNRQQDFENKNQLRRLVTPPKPD